jgi:site-specific recombinase XerD
VTNTSSIADAILRGGNRTNERKGRSMARTHYQRGNLTLVGPKGAQWWRARWREYVELSDGTWQGIPRKRRLGGLEQFPTERAAKREFDRTILDRINRVSFKPLSCFTFSEFAAKWEKEVMSQFKPSTQRSISCEVRTGLVPHFGKMRMNEITGEDIQRFVSQSKASPKYTKNMVADFRMIWKYAALCKVVDHDPLLGVRLPKVSKVQAPAFTLDQVQLIMEASAEPFFTLYWLAASAGMRGCELSGFRAMDIDPVAPIVTIFQGAWEGKVQTPKTGNAYRSFRIAEKLAAHLREFSRGMAPTDLIFSKDGKPRRQDGVVKYHLKPLCAKLGIEWIDGMGLHAFRHANSTFMDQLHAPVAVRLARIGHGDFGTTKGYMHLVSQDDDRIAEGIQTMLSTRVM